MLNILNYLFLLEELTCLKKLLFVLVPETVVLLEKNGAGKSWLKILAGDFKPDSGQIATEKELPDGLFCVKTLILKGKNCSGRSMRLLLK
jgi:ATP-binding cassette subfamily F protein 3